MRGPILLVAWQKGNLICSLQPQNSIAAQHICLLGTNLQPSIGDILPYIQKPYTKSMFVGSQKEKMI